MKRDLISKIYSAASSSRLVCKCGKWNNDFHFVRPVNNRIYLYKILDGVETFVRDCGKYTSGIYFIKNVRGNLHLMVRKKR